MHGFHWPRFEILEVEAVETIEVGNSTPGTAAPEVGSHSQTVQICAWGTAEAVCSLA